MRSRQTRHLVGRQVLQSIRAELAQYHDRIAASNKRISIIRFAVGPSDSPLWRQRMEASRISAGQKAKAFAFLGYHVDEYVLLGSTSAAEYAALIDSCSADPAISAVIVNLPPPPHLASVVQRLDPGKDIDGLLGERSRQQSCATADGIARVVRAFAHDDPRIAVVGGNGFVGRGVVRLLRHEGRRVLGLDAQDDLTRARSADIVVSAVGNPHLLTDEHIRPHHRLVVDSGFLPRHDGSIAGDIAPSAWQVPQYITPVPGGIGPVEMAVLMERMVRLDVDPTRESWTVPQVPYLRRGEFAALMIPAPASGARGASAGLAPDHDKESEHRTRPGRGLETRSCDRGL